MESIKKFLREYTDQAISSLDSREVVDSVRPGPGQQLGEVQPCEREATPSSKPQASSIKPQANQNLSLIHI